MKESPKSWRTLLNRWISGEASQGDERSLQVMAEDDPFLADAWEGYRSLPEEDHARSVTMLKADLRKRYTKKQKGTVFYLTRIAAVGVVLIAAWWLFRSVGSFDKRRVLTFDEKTEVNAAKNTAPETAPMPEESDAVVNMADEYSDSLKAKIIARDVITYNLDVSQANNSQPAAPPGVRAVPPPKSYADLVPENKGEANEPVSKDAAKIEEEQKRDALVDARLARKAVEKEAEKKTEEEAQKNAEASKPAEAVTLVEAAPSPSPAAAEEDIVLEQSEKAEVYVPPIVQTIKGQVTDLEGNPLLGATVLIDNTPQGTVTDIQGFFSIDSPIENPMLRIVYVGFQDQQVVTNGEMFLNVQLSEGVALDQVAINSLKSRRKKEAGPVFEPKGGFKKFEKYLAENLRMPQAAIDAGVKGQVTVAFRVGKDGYPADIEVFRSLGYGCDEEAVRLLEEGPKWKGPSGTLHNYTFDFK